MGNSTIMADVLRALPMQLLVLQPLSIIEALPALRVQATSASARSQAGMVIVPGSCYEAAADDQVVARSTQIVFAVINNICAPACISWN
jgi:hypothetical protein